MNLVIDVGNTLIKYAVFDEKKIIHRGVADCCEFINEDFLKKYTGITKAIVSTVRDIHDEQLLLLKKNFSVLVLGDKTKLPFKNTYKTAHTLGYDRIAGLAGAWALYPGQNVLIIDAGTCITVDFLNENGVYSGGSISPGLNMKLKALHTFTGKLPLVKLRQPRQDFGVDTETSILTGVVNGTLAELEWRIQYFKTKYPDLKVLVCGGDADFLAKSLKSSIFAVPDLTLTGLNELLEYNER